MLREKIERFEAELRDAKDRVMEGLRQLRVEMLNHERLRQELFKLDPDRGNARLVKDGPDGYNESVESHGRLVDTSAERAYRRGFAQGAARVLYALDDGASLKQINQWVWHEVWAWRWEVGGISYVAIVDDPPPVPRPDTKQTKGAPLVMPKG
jgi:hypothetical protein